MCISIRGQSVLPRIINLIKGMASHIIKLGKNGGVSATSKIKTNEPAKERTISRAGHNAGLPAGVVKLAEPSE